ncbi:MAG: NifU family protein [Flavobacteriales bacterium]|nr:NifU family protein [Flavobacteriales bacterium]
MESIERALDELRPYLEEDGGGISLIGITDNMVAKLEFLGACKDCSMSLSTFKAGVEKAVMQSAPSITKVEVINMPSK